MLLTLFCLINRCQLLIQFFAVNEVFLYLIHSLVHTF